METTRGRRAGTTPRHLPPAPRGNMQSPTTLLDGTDTRVNPRVPGKTDRERPYPSLLMTSRSMYSMSSCLEWTSSLT